MDGRGGWGEVGVERWEVNREMGVGGRQWRPEGFSRRSEGKKRGIEVWECFWKMKRQPLPTAHPSCLQHKGITAVYFYSDELQHWLPPPSYPLLSYSDDPADVRYGCQRWRPDTRHFQPVRHPCSRLARWSTDSFRPDPQHSAVEVTRSRGGQRMTGEKHGAQSHGNERATFALDPVISL